MGHSVILNEFLRKKNAWEVKPVHQSALEMNILTRFCKFIRLKSVDFEMFYGNWNEDILACFT